MGRPTGQMSVVSSVQRDGLEASQLSATLALHEAALESMTHGVCAIDAAGRIVLLNRRFVEMCNLSPDAVRVGISFTDNSMLSAGPNSVLILDKYAFDAASGKGAMEANLARGTLAAVSGKMVKSAPESMKIRTPAAIMGVRGTEFVVKVEDPAGR